MNICFVSSDPGSFNYCVSFFRLLKDLQIGFDYVFIAVRHPNGFFGNDINITLADHFDQAFIQNADLLVTGTSPKSGFEIRFIKYAKTAGITSVSLIDYDINVLERFQWEDELVLPDFIFGTSLNMYSRLQDVQFNENNYFFSGNLYYEYFKKYFEENKVYFMQKAGDVKRKLNIQNESKTLIFFSDAISAKDNYQTNNNQYYSHLNIKTIFSQVSSQCRKIDPKLNLVIRPHPLENINKWAGEKIYTEDLFTLIYFCDYGVGLFSNIINDCCALGFPVLRYEPGMQKDLLGSFFDKEIPRITDPEQLYAGLCDLFIEKNESRMVRSSFINYDHYSKIVKQIFNA
jgi:hypothetical protein